MTTLWLALAIPVIAAIFLYVFYPKRVVWWELSLPIVGCLILVTISVLASECSQTTDTEYWGGLAKTSEYYEDWNERVPCSHPQYCTRTVSRTDGNGRSYTTTESYQCGYQHAYDVDYHPPYWIIRDTNGLTIHVSQSTYRRLVRQFGNKSFVDLRRNYHTNDGDKYVTTWPGSRETSEPTTTAHSYENRIQASRSVFNYRPVPDTEVKDYRLFEYPTLRGHLQNALLGIDGPEFRIARKNLSYYNGLLGPRKQARIFILVFLNQPREAALAQEAYWVGGNKNEFVLTVGLDDTGVVQWVHPFSWTKEERLKVDVRAFVEEQETFDPVATVDYLYESLEASWTRRQFAEFEYLNVEPPMWSVILTYVLTILLTVGLSAFVVLNDVDENSPRRRTWRR